MRIILLLPLMARCLDVRIWRMFVFMSVVDIVWGSVGMFVVSRPLLKIVKRHSLHAVELSQWTFKPCAN